MTWSSLSPGMLTSSQMHTNGTCQVTCEQQELHGESLGQSESLTWRALATINQMLCHKGSYGIQSTTWSQVGPLSHLVRD